MKKEENKLGTEKISKLILRFSIPCIISMLVNSLYNIVDQIFIGRGVGMLGNGATNVVFPISVIALAISLMIGDGASAYLSLKLGEKKQNEASKGVGNARVLSLVFSLLFASICLLFLPQLLHLFGCTENLKEYANNYGHIIVLGLPFVMIGTSLNSLIRSDGSPKYAMTSMVIGAILNMIFDPIFIFIFHWGVEGAAIATILSQMVTFLLNLLYVKKFKTIHLKKEDLKLENNTIKKVLLLGISSFITQMSIVVVIATENNLLGSLGATTEFGADIPITVLGIVMKISQILYSIVLGIAIGAQPIFGYNYGAKKVNRVKQALKIVLKTSLIITTIAFILFQTIPDKLILLFGSGDSNYVKFACLTFRIYLMLVICNGIQIPAGIFFQAIGKSSKSAILSLSRQIVLLVPAMLILGNYFGLMGVLYAGVVADGLAFLLAVILLILETKNFSTIPKQEIIAKKSKQKGKRTEPKMIITIAREYGSGGRYIGQMIAEKLNIPCYDKEFILKVAEETGLAKEYIIEREQKRSWIDTLSNGYYNGLSNADELFLKESEIIKEIAKKESCVIIGRCADFVLKDQKNTINVFIYNDIEHKIKRATTYYNIKKEKAEKEINKINKLRANHYKHYTGKTWGQPENYDIVINSDTLGVEKSADLIIEIIKKGVQK